jgi:hypothetical protein
VSDGKFCTSLLVRPLIALPLKRGCETVKVWSAWPARQMPGIFDAEK